MTTKSTRPLTTVIGGGVMVGLAVLANVLEVTSGWHGLLSRIPLLAGLVVSAFGGGWLVYNYLQRPPSEYTREELLDMIATVRSAGASVIMRCENKLDLALLEKSNLCRIVWTFLNSSVFVGTVVKQIKPKDVWMRIHDAQQLIPLPAGWVRHVNGKEFDMHYPDKGIIHSENVAWPPLTKNVFTFELYLPNDQARIARAALVNNIDIEVHIEWTLDLAFSDRTASSTTHRLRIDEHATVRRSIAYILKS